MLLSIACPRYLLKSILVPSFWFFEVPLCFANRVLKCFQSVLRTVLKSDQLSSFTVNCRGMLLASMVYLIFGMQVYIDDALLSLSNSL